MAKWREHRFNHADSMVEPTTLEVRVVASVSKPEGSVRVKADTPESDWRVIAWGVDPANEEATQDLLSRYATAEDLSEAAGAETDPEAQLTARQRGGE